jgi:hypothetical protein
MFNVAIPWFLASLFQAVEWIAYPLHGHVYIFIMNF